MVASVVTVPKTQKAQVTREFGLNPKFEEIPVPEPKDDELLVHVIYSGVCHTDVGVVKNEYRALGLGLPIIAGHEGAGIVVKIGKSVTGFKEGDRVGCAVSQSFYRLTRGHIDLIILKFVQFFCKYTYEK